jgi:hypothetical protein
LLREAFDKTVAVFVDPPRRIGRHTDVQRTVLPVGHDVAPGSHTPSIVMVREGGPSTNLLEANTQSFTKYRN